MTQLKMKSQEERADLDFAFLVTFEGQGKIRRHRASGLAFLNKHFDSCIL
jgi:hypothetical protein